jgi:hypothetical protein
MSASRAALDPSGLSPPRDFGCEAPKTLTQRSWGGEELVAP